MMDNSGKCFKCGNDAACHVIVEGESSRAMCEESACIFMSLVTGSKVDHVVEKIIK